MPENPVSKPLPTCALTVDQGKKRTIEWSDIAALALRTERRSGGLTATFPAELANQLQDLADKEMQCCGSWLSVAITYHGDVVQLDLTTTSPDGQALIMGMAGMEEA